MKSQMFLNRVKKRLDEKVLSSKTAEVGWEPYKIAQKSVLSHLPLLTPNSKGFKDL
jgi:hypothetical protein